MRFAEAAGATGYNLVIGAVLGLVLIVVDRLLTGTGRRRLPGGVDLERPEPGRLARLPTHGPEPQPAHQPPRSDPHALTERPGAVARPMPAGGRIIADDSPTGSSGGVPERPIGTALKAVAGRNVSRGFKSRLLRRPSDPGSSARRAR